MGDTCGAPPPRYPPTHFNTVANSARELIHRGFVGGQMLSVSCLGPFGTRLTSSATIAHDFTVGAMSATFVEGQRKHELTFSTLNNQISGTTTFLNLWCPGMTVAVSTSLKEGSSDGSINVQYVHPMAAMSAKVFGTKDRPEAEVAVNCGSQNTFAGGRFCMDARTRHLDASQVGCGYRNGDTTATVLCDPFIDKSIDGYFTRYIQPQTQVGAHLTFLLESKLKSVNIAGSHVLDSQTTVKWKLEDCGIASGLLQYSPSSQVTCGLAAAVNFRNLRQAPSVGLSLQVLPS